MDTTYVGPGTADPGARLHAAVRLMLASLAVMTAAIVTLYFAPLAVAPLLAASLYAGLWAYERRLGTASPITRTMTVFYLLLAAFPFYGGDDPSWAARFSPMVYWTLAALIFALLAAGRPFTAVYAGDAGFAPLHRATSLIWGGLHLASGLAALVLLPGPGFLYVPLGLMALGALATIWLNFVSMGPAGERRSSFELESYSFREATGRSDRETFHRVIAEAFRPDAQSALGPRRKIDIEAIIRAHRDLSEARPDTFLPFLALAGDRPVGGICIFFDHRRRGLPIEDVAHIDLAPWRRMGRIAEVGRLGVLPRYRISPALLKGLFKCVIEAAAERRVHVLFNDAFDFQVGMYEKLGFKAFRGAPHGPRAEQVTSYGIKVVPMMLSLAGMVRRGGPDGVANDVHNVLAPYVMERFFKHIAVREMVRAFLGRKRSPEEIEPEEIEPGETEPEEIENAKV